jgi:hypothetical protein
MAWLKQTLTGADNETLAIGRVLGMAIAAVLLIALPVAAPRRSSPAGFRSMSGRASSMRSGSMCLSSSPRRPR